MANIDKIYVVDTGTSLLFDTKSNIEGATALELEIKDPEGVESTLQGVLYGTTKIKYVVTENDFNISGEYSVQAAVTNNSGYWLGDVVQLVIYKKFK